MRHTRREFLGATAGTLSALALNALPTEAAPPAGGGHVRKDVAKLDAMSQDIVDLKKAVDKMKTGTDLGAADKRRWLAQSIIHGQLGNGYNACQHGNWFFLPWHRMYLYFFEEIVRELSGNDKFALPYWDWTKDRQLPALFWGAGNPLDDPVFAASGNAGRRAGLTSASTIADADYNRYVSRTVISRILGRDDFETFAGAAVTAPGDMAGAGELEGEPHNFIHRWVGGDMVTGGSPYDPIFWLHHCNIDRLWVAWTRKHPDSTPDDKGWLNTKFQDFCDRKGDPAGLLVSQTLDTTALGYQYDVTPAAPAVAARRGPVKILASESGASPLLADGVASFALTAKAPLASAINDVAGGPSDERKGSVRMRLRNIQIPKDQDVGLDVFINCQKLPQNTPITDPSYVGSRTFFVHSHHDHGKGDGTVSFLFGVTAEFARLYADRPLPENEPIKVYVVARPLFKEGLATVQELKPSQVTFEVVGSGR